MSNTLSISLPGNSRQFLRDAVRRHGALTAYLPAGTKVNDLSKDQLLQLAADLKIDVHGVITLATASALASFTDYATKDVVSRDAPAAEEAPEEDVTSVTDASVAQEADALRRELGRAMVEGDFDTVTKRIQGLITDAHKPAEVRIETVYVTAPEGTDPAAIMSRPVDVPQPMHAVTWGAAFGLSGALAKRKINVYPAGPGTPTVDDRYRWPENVTQAALCAMGRGRNIWLYGPAGTGKSSFAEQLAARTGRPFALIPCDDTTEAPELVGMTVPHQGSVRWQDGVLTAAMRVPHNIILIDEPTVARAGAVMVLQSVLASGVLSIKETGEVVRAAEGVRFVVADNTNGTGGGTSEGYEGTRRMNRATLDRFASFLRVDYMAPEAEALALVAHTSCTRQLADVLVECAGLTRKARVTHAIGLRRLIAWAEALTDGLDMRTAFEVAILNSCARDDREPTEQCCALGLDTKRVKAALLGAAPAPVIPKVAPGSAAADFA